MVLITAYFVAISAQIRIAKENKLAFQIGVLHPSPKLSNALMVLLDPVNYLLQVTRVIGSNFQPFVTTWCRVCVVIVFGS
jgi:hypothetical protein